MNATKASQLVVTATAPHSDCLKHRPTRSRCQLFTRKKQTTQAGKRRKQDLGWPSYLVITYLTSLSSTQTVLETHRLLWLIPSVAQTTAMPHSSPRLCTIKVATEVAWLDSKQQTFMTQQMKVKKCLPITLNKGWSRDRWRDVQWPLQVWIRALRLESWLQGSLPLTTRITFIATKWQWLQRLETKQIDLLTGVCTAVLSLSLLNSENMNKKVTDRRTQFFENFRRWMFRKVLSLNEATGTQTQNNSASWA